MEHNRTGDLKRIAYVACLGVIGIISTEFGIIGVLPQAAAYYNITIDHAGILLSAFALTIFLIGPFIVLISSAFDKKKMMTAAIILFLASNIASVFANSLQASLANLGVSLGTAVGGWFIANKGINDLPWLGAGFGVVAVAIIVFRTALERKTSKNYADNLKGKSHRLAV